MLYCTAHYYAKLNIRRRFKFTRNEMTKLANHMVYGCCMLLLFGTKSLPLCRNYNFELQMQKHDRAYSTREFRRKYVCGNEM